ncbi:MAG: DUF362 domain-containing protein [Verrucomicrobiota bacterium]
MKILSRIWHRLSLGFHRKGCPDRSRDWRHLAFPLFTAAALVWFLIRVIPKPSRASYPCQRAAFPLASSFVIWLLACSGGVVAFCKVRWRKFQPLCVAMALMLITGLLALAADKIAEETASPRQPWTPSDPPNSPMGLAQGIFPGRVVWIRDTNATPWLGDTNSGHWWDSGTGTRLEVVDRMTSRSLQTLTGAKSDAEAWEKLFHFFNTKHGRGDVGYQPGEIVALKPNCNNAYAGNEDDDNQIDASPQTIQAMLRQLVYQAHVPQTNILVYEAVRALHNHIIQPCRAEFPGVVWMDSKGTNGICEKVVWHKNAFALSVTENNKVGTSVPEQVYRATYVINLALLKGHPTCGVTLTAKNHYGSIDGRDHREYINTWQHHMGIYNPFIDLIGTKQLGGKTLLFMIDGLYGTRDANDPVAPEFAAWTNFFGGQWSSSLFMSLDPVAIDSVGLDFLRCEFGLRLTRQPGHDMYADNYLHEAALANNPPSGTVYQPDGTRLGSLGTHEHWNNPKDKQYSRNLDPQNGTGIELVVVKP